MINDILNSVDRFKRQTAFLKKESPIYPSFLIMDGEDTGLTKERIASTRVRIERNGKYYLVHCVERYFWNEKRGESYSAEALLQRLMHSAYFIKEMYAITGEREDVDEDQIPEKERIKQLLNG